MASALFQTYDRNLRRVHMLTLLEHMAAEQRPAFRASLVVNAHTGLPVDLAVKSDSLPSPVLLACAGSV